MTDVAAAPANPGLVAIRTALHELQDALPTVMAAMDSANPVETDLAAGAAALSLIALVFPPAAILADVVKIVQAVVLLQTSGLVHAGQPEDPAMLQATGRSGMGGH